MEKPEDGFGCSTVPNAHWGKCNDNYLKMLLFNEEMDNRINKDKINELNVKFNRIKELLKDQIDWYIIHREDIDYTFDKIRDEFNNINNGAMMILMEILIDE